MGDVMIRFSGLLGSTTLMACLFFSRLVLADAPTEPAAVPTIPEISSKMTGVAVDLAKTQTGKPVQDQQKKIVSDLDALIAALEKACQGCRMGIARNNPRRPAPDSNPHGGTGGIGDLVDPRQGEKDWAKLSPRERERILQSMSEGFPPEYRTVLERYYRRLADEKTAAADGSQAQSKPAASSEKP
jgi:hypothetical protein